jgi:hypothetical protein
MGTIFELTTNGSLTALHAFTNGMDGANPEAALTLWNDGSLYGTTYGGVFKVTTNGTLTRLATFNGADGDWPDGLALGNDTNFYGVTVFPPYRTIFQMTASGGLTTLFASTNLDFQPGLTLGEDGNFYGIGSGSSDTIFCLSLAPTIIAQPQSQTNYAGTTAAFFVSATSLATNLYPTGYQWQKNQTNLADGGNISGATSRTLMITGISDSDAASYSVVISNAEASVSSSTATLTVNDALVMAAQPLSQTVGAGSRVTFTAEVYGAPPFVFQWSFNGTPIGSPAAGTNFTSITLTNVGTNQSGNYSVQVFNGSGSVTSSNAVLTVIAQPTLSLEMLAGYPVLSLYGTLGNGFMVQYNTNLADLTWLPLLSLTNLSTSPYQFLDPSGVGQPARFYRAFFTQ